jgi:hypothetical protein
VPQPCANDVDIDTLLQKPDRCGMAEHMRRNAAIFLLWSGATQASCVSFDDFVKAEPRQRFSLTRHEQRSGAFLDVSGLLLQYSGSFGPKWAASPLVALSMESDAQRPVEIDVGNAQVSDLLHPCLGVIEDHEDTPIAK